MCDSLRPLPSLHMPVNAVSSSDQESVQTSSQLWVERFVFLLLNLKTLMCLVSVYAFWADRILSDASFVKFSSSCVNCFFSITGRRSNSVDIKFVNFFFRGLCFFVKCKMSTPSVRLSICSSMPSSKNLYFTFRATAHFYLFLWKADDVSLCFSENKTLKSFRTIIFIKETILSPLSHPRCFIQDLWTSVLLVLFCCFVSCFLTSIIQLL